MYKNKWILGILFGFPFLLGFLVALPKWPYWNFAGNVDTWIIFWGTYIGALGTVLMAVIAVETLKFSKRQNSPFVYPSIEIVVQKQYDPQATNDDQKWFNEVCYCLRIKNYGVGTATKIRLKIDCSNPELFKLEHFAGNINWLNSVEFALGSKEEKLLFLCPADITPAIRRKEKSDNKFWFDSFIKEFKNSSVSIQLSYSEDDSSKPKTFSFPINGVLTAQTTKIQVLDDINRSIQGLKIEIEKLQNVYKTE